ncbi:MAG: NAD-dependent epimerase/dehydratase family protein, partial [Bacteroidota bacterium]
MPLKKSRRAFIETGLKTGLTLPFLFSGLLGCQAKAEQESKNETKTANKSLNILILGGTSFLGPHQVAYALDRGHTVSTFTRGKTQPTIHQDLFKKVEALDTHSDGASALDVIRDRKPDLVVLDVMLPG